MRFSKRTGVVLLVLASILAAALLVGLSTSREERITPNPDFFTVSLQGPPSIDINGWRLHVEGLVLNELNLSYSDVLKLQNVTEAATLRCVTGPSARAYFTGIRLPDFMGLIGLKPGAKEMVFFSPDGYSTSLTIEELSRDDVLLAWNMNNVTLPLEQGFPLKLVVPGDWGYKWAKWIDRIQVVDYDYKGYWESRGWADDARISPISDWKVHATLLSVAAVLGTFSTLSGMRNSQQARIARRLPAIFAKRYHRYVSMLFYLVLLGTFSFWAVTTYDLRGAVFYSFHGRIALITTIFAIVGIVSGAFMLGQSKRLVLVHWMSNLAAYLLLLITIVLGVTLVV